MNFGTSSQNENLLKHFEIDAINHQCLDQISLNRSIFIKQRGGKMLYTYFRRNLLRNSGTSLINGGFEGVLKPPVPELATK